MLNIIQFSGNKYRKFKYKGLSLTEMLIIVVCVSIIAVIIIRTFKGQTSVYIHGMEVQKIQDQVKRALKYLTRDIKMAYIFKKVESHNLEFLMFKSRPDLKDIYRLSPDKIDPEKVAQTVKVTYIYDKTKELLTRTMDPPLTPADAKVEFKNLTEKMNFYGLKWEIDSATPENSTLVSFEVKSPDDLQKLVGIRVKLVAKVEKERIKGKNTFFISTRIISVFRNNLAFYGPIEDTAGNPTGRIIDISHPFKKHFGYFSTIDENTKY